MWPDLSYPFLLPSSYSYLFPLVSFTLPFQKWPLLLLTLLFISSFLPLFLTHTIVQDGLKHVSPSSDVSFGHHIFNHIIATHCLHQRSTYKSFECLLSEYGWHDLVSLERVYWKIICKTIQTQIARVYKTGLQYQWLQTLFLRFWMTATYRNTHTYHYILMHWVEC